MSNIVSTQTQQQPADMASQIVAMASNPDFDVEKLKALIDLQNSELKRQAEVAFSDAFAKLQAEIPTIIEDKKFGESIIEVAHYNYFENGSFRIIFTHIQASYLMSSIINKTMQAIFFRITIEKLMRCAINL